MDNFGFLDKGEVSYILNNEKIFGNVLVEQVEKYCQKRKYVIDKIKAMSPEWEEGSERLNFKIENDEIIISKTDEAKKYDNWSSELERNLIGLFFLVMIIVVLVKVENHTKFWIALWGIPIFIIILIEAFIQRKSPAVEEEKNRELRILKEAKYQLIENGKLFYEKEIDTVNLFWKDDSDTGRSVTLELKGENHIAILIDEKANDLELLRRANDISNFLNKKLNVFWGESPYKAKMRL